MAENRDWLGECVPEEVPAAPRRRAPEFLEAGARTFRERNGIYGDTYLNIGVTLQAMFPKGVALANAADHNRYATFLQCVGKLHRYAAQLERGGHADSALDLTVYAAMLAELTGK